MYITNNYTNGGLFLIYIIDKFTYGSAPDVYIRTACSFLDKLYWLVCPYRPLAMEGPCHLVLLLIGRSLYCLVICGDIFSRIFQWFYLVKTTWT